MIGFAGLAASLLALLASFVGLLLAVQAARAGSYDPRLRRATALVAALGMAAIAFMVGALVARDFSVAYVAQVGSRSTPLLYTVASLWGALEGSILFWAGLLGTFTWLLVVRTARPVARLLPVALAVLCGLLVFFWGIVVGPGNPWGQVSPVPPDGPGPNPLLQNHPLMAVHPPLLYIGLVGFAVPFALTVAALVEGTLDRSWLVSVRRWTLVPWVALTAGLALGAWWSYAVLGWGGYWAWDPVENVALLPWLTATAFLHSAMVQERRGSLVVWNVALVITSFCLTLLATLVTRSGVLASVHAFTQSAIGPLFLALLGGVVMASIVLAAWRLPRNPDPEPLGTRGLAFLVNNLLLVAIAATVLVGTLYPLVVEAVGSDRISVGAPYFERVVGPVALALLVLLGVGPSLPWGARNAAARRKLLPGAIVAAAAAFLLVVRRAPPEQILGIVVATFALVQSLAYLGWRLGRRTPQGQSAVRSRARTGGAFVAHAGIAIVALVVVSAAAGREQAVATLRPGEVLTVGPYQVRFVRLDQEALPGRSVVRAEAEATGPGIDGPIAPALTRFGPSSQSLPTPAILPTPIADLYVTLINVDPLAGTASLRMDVQPLMSWMWVGGLLTAAGGLIAAWPMGRARAPAPVPAGHRQEADLPS